METKGASVKMRLRRGSADYRSTQHVIDRLTSTQDKDKDKVEDEDEDVVGSRGNEKGSGSNRSRM